MIYDEVVAGHSGEGTLSGAVQGRRKHICEWTGLAPGGAMQGGIVWGTSPHVMWLVVIRSIFPTAKSLVPNEVSLKIFCSAPRLQAYVTLVR